MTADARVIAGALCEQCGENSGTARFCSAKCRAKHWRENGGKPGSGAPHGRAGVWLCLCEDQSVRVFRTELEALRYANTHDIKAMFVRYETAASGHEVQS